MEWCFSGTESLLYGNWNLHTCREGKCKVDHPYRLTGTNTSRKQKCCSPSCLWSQAQGIHLGKKILEFWTTRHRCICIYMWTLNWDANCFLPAESKDCMNSMLFLHSYYMQFIHNINVCHFYCTNLVESEMAGTNILNTEVWRLLSLSPKSLCNHSIRTFQPLCVTLTLSFLSFIRIVSFFLGNYSYDHWNYGKQGY